MIPDAAEYFGLSEGLRMPAGYALFSGETMLGEELFKTQKTFKFDTSKPVSSSWRFLRP